MFEYYNPNPYNKRVGDCSVRAVSKALGLTWEQAYAQIILEGFAQGDVPSSNAVWGEVLRNNGFIRAIDNSCPGCITVGDFAKEHPHGIFVLAVPNHVVTIKDGIIYDTWDSSDSAVLYYFKEAANRE